MKCERVGVDGRLHWPKFSSGTKPIRCVYIQWWVGWERICLKELHDAIVEA